MNSAHRFLALLGAFPDADNHGGKASGQTIQNSL